MTLLKEPSEYEIIPAAGCERIPSMTGHTEHKEMLKRLGLDKFDSGLEYERVETKRLHRLIEINYKLNGDVEGLAIPKHAISKK